MSHGARARASEAAPNAFAEWSRSGHSAVASPPDAASVLSPFAADVRAGLTASPKVLPSRYLYDALGSTLFEAICRLPWYEVTRAEQRLLDRHAAAICATADPRLIVELGPGSGDKLATLIRPLAQAGGDGRAARARTALHVHLIDISPAALDQASRTVGQLAPNASRGTIDPAAVAAPSMGDSADGATQLVVTTRPVTYEEGLRELPKLRPPFGRATVLFLGSNIGNFDPPAADTLLRAVRAALRPGDTLLLGLDLVKPADALQRAYDDPLGVTAAFNRNLLVRLNTELGADVDLDRFTHRAIWRADASRIEMHLVSRGAQTVHIPGADCTIAFADGETIWTESSYKYDLSSAHTLGRAAGFSPRDQWVDESGRFALTLFDV